MHRPAQPSRSAPHEPPRSSPVERSALRGTLPALQAGMQSLAKILLLAGGALALVGCIAAAGEVDDGEEAVDSELSLSECAESPRCSIGRPKARLAGEGTVAPAILTN